jgi:cytochrome P450
MTETEASAEKPATGLDLTQGFEALEEMFDLSDPRPRYARLLEEGGVCKPVDGFVIASSRSAVNEVLRDPGRFTSEGLVQLGNVRPLLPLSVDPPAHLKYRKILDPLFAPKKMDAAEADIAGRVNHFMDTFVARGSCDFTEEFAVPFPSSVFLGLMGLPWEELHTFLRLKDGILRPGGASMLDMRDVAGPSADERRRLQEQTGQEIYDYFDRILAERSRVPRDDILTQFLQVEVEGQKLSHEEILDICFLFLIAGLDTVTDSLTCFYAYLAQHPEGRRAIADDPDVINRAVEELLRWETPVAGVMRLATGDTELSGCPVKAGDVVSVSLGAANLDPTEFADALEVDLDRASNSHIAFGGGVHRCLGSHLARRELRVTLREWHRRIPDYELAPGTELNYLPGLRQVESVPLVWTP